MSLSQIAALQALWTAQPRAVRVFNAALEPLWDNTPDRQGRYPIYRDGEGCSVAIPPEGAERNAWPVARALAGGECCMRNYWVAGAEGEEARCYRVQAYPMVLAEGGVLIVEETERVDQALCHDERLRRLDSQLTQIMTHMADLLMNREEIDPLKLRLANPNLQPCRQIKGCRQRECPAHDAANLRCWEIPATRCPQTEATLDILSKFHFCNRCEVYLMACPDPLTRVGENFNRLMAFLQLKYEESLEVQRQIQHSERLAAIGELTLGIAHEMKNPLSVITTRLDCLSLELDALREKALSEDFAVLRHHAARMRQFLEGLLTFSMPADTAVHKPLNINDVILDTLPLVHKTLEKHRIRLKSRLTPYLPEILGDAVGIQQVLLNLFLNARDALPEGGVVEVATLRGRRNPEEVAVEISDNGCGISAAEQKKIFSPFYTTKAGHGGSGLGLAICTRIMERHTGRVAVCSRPGKGAKFTLFFKGRQAQPGE